MHRLGRSTARSTARECLLSKNGLVDRVIDRWAIALKAVDRPINRPSQRSKNRPLAVDRVVDRQQCRLLTRPPTAIFWSLFIWGSHGLFSTRFEVGFQYLSKCLSPLVLEPNTFISTGEFSRVFCKRDFLSFSPPNQS